MRSAFVFLFSAVLAMGASPSSPAAFAPPTWSINCGLWRTDSGFSSTIQLKNRLVNKSITVTPVLFLADGTEYSLAAMHLAASAIATIDVKSALAGAPASVAAHMSDYGSATLRYDGTHSALLAQTALGSPTLSESFMTAFGSVGSGSPAAQTLEALWWARDAGIGGFVALSNASAQTRDVSVEAVTASGQALHAGAFSLAPHATRLLDLLTLIGHGPRAGDAGGLRIRFNGLLGEVNASGGLENRQEGYSAVIPFWQAPMAGMKASPAEATVAHPGIMVGAADPLMGFPTGTRFIPYLALRNLTSAAQPVSLTFYTPQGTALSAPPQLLQAFESRQLDVIRMLDQLGLRDFNGDLTLTVSHAGGVNDLMSVAGSVDQKGTYVFEVNGRAVEQKLSKQSPYWSVKNGNDTMVALWNPTSAAQDVMLTLHYASGSGTYHFRVHLAPHATANVDLKELIANQSRDEEGNMLPLNVQEGSFVFHNAADVHAPLSVDVSVGIFNVAKGTCYYGTVDCDGYYGSLIVDPSSSFLSANGGQVMLEAYGQYSDGSEPNIGGTFSSSNSSIASVSGNYVTAGTAPGNATITASASLPVEGEYSGYNPSCESLQPYDTFTGTASVSVGDDTPTITGIDPSDWNAGAVTAVTFSGQYFGTNAPALSFSPSSGISYTLTGYNDTQITANVSVASSTPNEDVTVTVQSNGYNGSGFQSNGDGQSAKSAPATAAVHAKMTYTDITVIGWVDPTAITLPTGENSSLAFDLSYPSDCAYDLSQWAIGNHVDLTGPADPPYANAWLLKNSPNSPPPSTITPSSYWMTGNFRIYNDYGSPSGGAYKIGSTPNPCGTGDVPGWLSAGQPSQYNGATGVSGSGQTYQLAEGRVGKVGQAVNQTLNGMTTPWIWTVIEFNSAGTPNWLDHAMFPTYWVYINGTLSFKYPQSSVSAFIANNASYQRTPSQIQ
jgi:hypothetical protein